MPGSSRLVTPLAFTQALFERMQPLNAALGKLALYEFRYGLENLYPPEGWDSVELDSPAQIEALIASREFYEAIESKPREKDRIVLDARIVRLNRMLMAGLVRGAYSPEWVDRRFYFDVRGFYFLPRTVYFTAAARAHLGGSPYLSFEPRQKRFDVCQDIGYLDFLEANREIDSAFTALVRRLIEARGTPLLITLAGPTAAGKTEITERLLETFEQMGKQATTIEMDNFLLDRDYRDNKPMGRATTHFALFQRSLQEILQGKPISIPRYDSLTAVSSHDLNGNLKPGCQPIRIEPADIIFLEGNFPFQMEGIGELIGVKVVYLTDDPVRLKRKWKRDIDYRKNYDPAHFRNRYFKTQFLRAEDCYRPQIEACDIVVDTTAACIWATPELRRSLG